MNHLSHSETLRPELINRAIARTLVLGRCAPALRVGVFNLGPRFTKVCAAQSEG